MKKVLALSVASILLVAVVAFAVDAREGTVSRIDADQKTMVVQGKDGNSWNLYWSETTQLKDGLTFAEIRVGDVVQFESVDKEGKTFITQIWREEKAAEKD